MLVSLCVPDSLLASMNVFVHVCVSVRMLVYMCMLACVWGTYGLREGARGVIMSLVHTRPLIVGTF